MFATVNDTFKLWLIDIMKMKGWNQSELARRAGLSPAAITDVLKGRRNAGTDFCDGIAAAVKFPPAEVYRIAGLLPPEPDKDDRLYKIQTLYHTLKDETNKERALDFLEFLSGLEEKNDRSGKRPKQK